MVIVEYQPIEKFKYKLTTYRLQFLIARDQRSDIRDQISVRSMVFSQEPLHANQQ